jgi:rhamnose transport system substrate-binding protein
MRLNSMGYGSNAAKLGVGLGLALLALTGCSKEEPASTNSSTPSTPAQQANGTAAAPTAGGKKKILFVFKVGGISYSQACKAGADQANADPALNAEVTYEAPDASSDLAGKQNDIIEQAIVNKVDAIVVSPDDSNAIVPTLNKAADAGIKIFTWDADAPSSKRQFYVAAVDDVQIGADIADALAKLTNQKGKMLLLSGQPTAENLNLHLKGMEEGFKKYPGITVVQPTIYNDDKLEEAKSKVLTALQANPDVVGIACANSVSPHGAGEAVKTLNKVGQIKVWGLGLPSENKTYLKDGSVSGLYLWDPKQLTYLTAKLVRDALDGKTPQDGATLPGVEGKLMVKGATVTLPLRLEINKDNVDKLTF